MSALGIVSIAVGVLGVCYGGFLFVAPAALMRWFKGTATTNGRTRTFGAFMLPLGVAMIWAGASEEGSFDLNGQSKLALILSLIGWVLAASYAHLGRVENAQAALVEAQSLRPGLTAEIFALLYSTNPDFRDRYLEGLRIAGLED